MTDVVWTPALEPRRRRGRLIGPRPLTAHQQQVLDGWIRMLDVDLPLAQAVFRDHPVGALPLPPIALPAYVTPDGRVAAPAIEAPTSEEAAAETAAPVLPVRGGVERRGAYARRARASRP